MPQPERAPRPPDYKAYLAACARAWQQAVEHPTEHNLHLLRAGEAILYRELQKPGRFELGIQVATPGAVEAMASAGNIPSEFLLRHKHADWGDMDDFDREQNDLALIHGSRLLSAYATRRGERLWVITEWDRSATTLLLPEEY